MTDLQAFVNGPKTLIVAPAGHGKTHTIVECLRLTMGKQLVLTHTHAGIASIKDKIRKENVEAKRYHIETISSFIQKYVHAFYTGNDLPAQDDRQHYHNFITQAALPIFRSALVHRVLRASYAGIFVDEYQDCTLAQHQIIAQISRSLPTHILGDPLQAIFDFNGDAVSFEHHLQDFIRLPDLDTPYRWHKPGHCRPLGDKIRNIRALLEQRATIQLQDDSDGGLNLILIKKEQIYDPRSEYRQKLDRIIQNKKNNPDLESLLILVPEYTEPGPDGKSLRKGHIRDRSKLKTQIDYTFSLTLLEAIDDKSFYSLSSASDLLIKKIDAARKKIKKIRTDILDDVFNATDLAEWFNPQGELIQKRDAAKAEISHQLRRKLEAFIQHPDPIHLLNILIYLKKTLKFKVKRQEVFRSFLSALNLAAAKGITVQTAMAENRNIIRRTGRKIHGKCLGTTLLTKGLEFDTVVLLDANKFDSPEHLYVAISRCCKRLIIFSETAKLNPY